MFADQYVGSGIAGLQGPMYGGTGCFHRRKVIYGLWPEGRMEIKGRSDAANLFVLHIILIFLGGS